MNKKSEFIQFIIVIVVFASLIALALAFTTDNPRYDLILEEKSQLTKAFFNTLFVSITALIGTLIFGFILFMMMRSKIVILRAISIVFNEIIMGTPLLVMIFIVVYAMGQIVNINDKLFLGIIALILYNSPYVANAYETTASVVDDDQYVVMDLYDFKWYEKYIYIIIPQMIKPFIPSLINNLSSVIKGSALLNIVSITEITYITTVISMKNWAVIEGYYVMWLMYLIITIPLSLLAKYLAKRLSNNNEYIN